MSDKPIIGLTMGDPAGIGPEIIVKAFRDLQTMADIVVIGDASVIDAAVTRLTSNLRVRSISSVPAARFDSGTIDVLDLDMIAELELGVVREAYGRASLAYVERAIELAQADAIDAITTAPINKQSTRLAGADHAGHTGLLAERTGVDTYSMMLIEGPLRVTHVSTHVSLRDACDLVTTESVYETITVTDQALHNLGCDEPTIAVAGLNPHASDDGLLGDEDHAEIAPAISQAQAAGIDAVGPESPDTIFTRAAEGFADCVVAMYHDQGHIPIKMMGFSSGSAVSGVNVTIGLPIIRTSVDHGTAFDIAGQGTASPRSLIDAVEIATQLVTSRSTP